MAQAYDGLRVVEFCSAMAGSLTGMMFADNGAEVIKVEPPGGDPSRMSPGFLMWNRGKKSVVLDLASAEGRRAAVDLALAADVVLESFEPGRAEALGLDHGALAARRPDLISCSISGFGLAKQHEAIAPRSELVFAKSGRVNGNDIISGALFSDRPIYITSPIGAFGAAGLAIQGISAALYARNRCGLGQRVETSLVDGLSATTMRLAFERQGGKVVPVRKGAVALIKRGIMLCFLTAKCRDGRYIQMCARQDDHFRNWFKAMELGHLLEEDRFRKAPLGFKSNEDIEEIEAIVRERMATRTQAEWMDIFSTKIDAGADPFLTSEEFLRHPQMVLNERVVTIADPRVGPVTQVGPLALFSDTPSRIGASAPAAGEHQGELAALCTRKGGPGTAAKPGAGLSRPPLEGVTILELANFLAAPMGATFLAELGARVIKIEPLEGDSYRRTGLEAAHILNGKESLPVDMKTPEGREIFRRAVSMSDALIHNFRPGVPARLGVDFDTVHKLNPRLVYLYAASYGSKGPESHRPAFHSTPHALCGAGILQGGRDNPPVDDSYPDPCAGIGVGVALAMGLLAREKTGRGQYVETTMLASSGYVHSERLTLYQGAPSLPTLDSQQIGFGALNRLYPTRDGWIMLSAAQAGEWQRLAQGLGHPEWLADPAYKDAAARQKNDAVLTAAIAGVIATFDAAALEARLNAAGAPAAAVSNSFQEFMVENELVAGENHPLFGEYWRMKPRTRFSVSPNRHGQPCAIGEHTVALLGELGYGEGEIAQLLDKRVVVAAAR